MGSNVYIQAYAKVYGVPFNECTKPEHKARIDAALDFVWQYPGQFPGESEMDADIRRDMTEPGSGTVSALAAHLTTKTDLEFPKTPPATAWEKIFITFKRMNDEAAEKPVGSQTTEPIAESPSSDITQIYEKNKQGGHETMSKEIKNTPNVKGEGTVRQTMSEAINSMTNGVNGGTPEASNAGEGIDSAMFDANVEQIKGRAQSLVNAFLNGRITKVYITKPALKDILEEGVQAKGVIVKPEDTLRVFKEKTGFVETPTTIKAADGTDKEEIAVAFTNVPAAYQDAARQMYNLLTAAVANPDGQTPVEVNVNEKEVLGSFKGYTYDLGDQKAVTVTSKELIAVLQDKTPGRLMCVGEQAQAVLTVVKEKASNTNSGKTSKRKAKDIGSTSVKILGRNELKDAAGVVEYLKTVNAEKKIDEKAPNVKSKLFIKYNAKDSGNNDVERTWRLPLKAAQYELTVVDSTLYDKLCPSSTGSKIVTISGADDKEGIEKLLNEFAQTMTYASVNKDNKSDILAGARDAVKKATEQASQEEADATGLGA